MISERFWNISRRRAGLLAVVAGLALGGCASSPSQQPAAAPAYHVIMAEIALQRGDYVTGLEEYTSAAIAGNDLETVRQAAALVYQYGSKRQIRRVAKRWLELALEHDFDAHGYAGRAALLGDDLGAASGHFEQLVTIIGRDEDGDLGAALQTYLLAPTTPKLQRAVANGLLDTFGADNAELQRIAARLATASKDYEKARTHAEAAVAAEPQNGDSVLLLADALIRSGSEEDGFSMAKEFIDEHPDARSDYANFLTAHARHDEVISVVSELLQDKPDDPAALYQLAIARINTGSLDLAGEDFTKLVSTDEYKHEAMFYLAGIAERSQRFGQAMRLYTQVGDGVFTMLAQERVATILSNLNQQDAAVHHLRDYAKRNPRYAYDIRLPLARLFANLERYDEALEIYDESLRSKPESEVLMLNRAELLVRKGDIDDAISQYRAALKENPDSALTLNALGYTLADRTAKHREAHTLIEKALELDPENPAIIDSMGWVLFRKGDYAGALVMLEKAYEKFPDPEVAAHLGETLWKLGERERAREVLRAAYQRFPSSKPLQETLKRLIDAGEDVAS